MITGMRAVVAALALTLAVLTLAGTTHADWPAKVPVVTPDDTVAAVRAQAKAGKVALLVYWAAWCGDCRKELPDLDAVAAELGGKGLRVLAYTIDEDPEPLVRLLAARPLRALEVVRVSPMDKPALQAATRALGGEYTGGIPYLALFDRRGKLIREWTRGKPVDPAELRAAIRPLL
jgi:thiol-disulfide isomerase/thioredoxin